MPRSDHPLILTERLNGAYREGVLDYLSDDNFTVGTDYFDHAFFLDDGGRLNVVRRSFDVEVSLPRPMAGSVFDHFGRAFEVATTLHVDDDLSLGLICTVVLEGVGALVQHDGDLLVTLTVAVTFDIDETIHHGGKHA